ncbi:MAG: hypothetical protein R3F62_12910 [Planctomycetota bacterium]
MSDPLGELLISQGLMTPAQLKTAVEFQQSLGGDLRTIVVKLGYVKDADLTQLMASEQNVSASYEITEDVIDFDTVRKLPRELLEKHQVLPLRSESNTVVLAMADPNNLRAIEEVQFLVNRSVEPAVATQAAIRRALSDLDELEGRYQTKRPLGGLSPAKVQRLRDMPIEKLLRAYLVRQIERGELSLDELLERADLL